MSSAQILNSFNTMESRKSLVCSINEWDYHGTTESGYSFVSADSITSFNVGLDSLQQRSGEQYIKFNVGAQFGMSPLDDAAPDVRVGGQNPKDKLCNDLIPTTCGYFFRVVHQGGKRATRKLECCKGPDRNESAKALYQAKAQLEDTVSIGVLHNT